MNDPSFNVDYRELKPSQLELLRPLWEKLKAYHVGLSLPLAARRAARSFDSRKEELLAKARLCQLRIEVACRSRQTDPVGYCISSLSSDGQGEIDSLFVEEGLRGRGIGTTLTRHALAWFDNASAISRTVVVAGGNDDALAFYRRFGFVAESVSMLCPPESGR